MRPSAAWSTIVAVLALLTLTRCVDPVSIDTGAPARLVVVDALVTSRDKPHVVRLSLSAAFERSADALDIPLEDAVVTLEDDQGGTYRFRETARGLYESDPSDLVTEVGRTYTLDVRLADGRHYRSTPERMRPVAPIDDVVIDYTPPTDLLPTGVFEFTTQFDDPAGEANYYRWQWRRYYRPVTGGFYEGRSFGALVANDRAFDGADGHRVVFGRQRYSLAFPVGYLVQVQQYSLSRDAYDFWALVQQQQELDGSIFDPPPDRIRSNVRNVDDPDEQVLGFFTVSDVEQQRACVCMSRFPDRPGLDPEGPFSTAPDFSITRPDFFNCDNRFPPGPGLFSCF
jgi:hypothetical protein